MATTPVTTFQFFKIQAPSDNSVVAFLSSKSDWDTYLQTCEKSAVYSNSVFIERNGEIIANLSYNDISKYNYVSYNNGQGGGNEYAFILEHFFTGSQNSSRVSLKYDLWANYCIGSTLPKQYMQRQTRTRWASDNSPLFLSNPEISPVERELITQSQEIWYSGTELYIIVVFSISVVDDFEDLPTLYKTTGDLYSSIGTIQPTIVIPLSGFHTAEDYNRFITQIIKNKNVLSVSISPYPPTPITKPRLLSDLYTLFPFGGFDEISLVTYYASFMSDTILRDVFQFNVTLDIPNITKPTTSVTGTQDINYEPMIHNSTYEYYVLWNSTSSFIIRPEQIVFTPDFNPQVQIQIASNPDGISASVRPVGGWYKGDALGEFSLMTFKNNAGFTLKNNETAEAISQALSVTSSILSLATTSNPINSSLQLGGNLVETFTKRYGDERKTPTTSISDSLVTNSYGGLLRLTHVKQSTEKINEVFDYHNRYGYIYNGLTDVRQRHAYFDYYQTRDCKLSFIPDNNDRTELENRFNSGVTMVYEVNGVINWNPWDVNNIEYSGS